MKGEVERTGRGHHSRGLRTLIVASAVTVAMVSGVIIRSILPAEAATTYGIDVSHYQGTVDWSSVRKDGIRFAYIKATEGTSYTDPTFDKNYPAAYYAGVVRGAYHFALPNKSSGAAQADFLYKNGGAWSADDRTLPAAVDLEYNPYGADCYGLTQGEMRSWIADFVDRYYEHTGRYAVIYTTAGWWKSCTGNYGGFANHHPLWLARYASTRGTLPSGWGYQTIWQYTASGSVAGISGRVDRNYFNGTFARVLALANNTK